MFLNTLPHAPQAHYPLQIIHYEGPPKPKQPPRRTLVPTPVELVDLTYLDDEEHSCEVSGSGSRGGDSGDVSSIDSYAPTTKRESVMPAFQEDARNGASQEPPPSTGSSQGNAIFMENNQPDSDADEVDLHEDDEGSYMSDRLEVPNIANPEGSGFPIVTNGAIALETGNGAMNEVSQPSRGRLLSTPPASPSMMSVDQSDSRYIPMQAATHQPQRSTDEKKAEREVSLPTSESTSSSGSDTEDDDNGSKHTTLLTRKRKRPSPANSASHKQQSRRPNIRPAERRKPSTTRTRPLSSHLSNTRLASGAQSSGYGTKMRHSEDSSDESSEGNDNRGRHLQKRPKSTATRQSSVLCARSNARNPLSTHASPHASWEMRHPAKSLSPGKARWHLSDLTFHSPSANVSFLTALFHARGNLEILSPSCAVKLLENVVSKAIKLDDITIKPLTPDMWFLTSLVDYISDVAERGTGQPASALPSLQANRTDAAAPRDDGNNDVDDESSPEDYNKGDENDKYSSDLVNEPSSSKKNSRWSKNDDSRLRSWKEEGKPWGWIYRQFSNRSPGAVQVRWHTKLRGKA